MKKILAILLAAMMLFSVVACGGNNNDVDEPNTDNNTGDNTDNNTGDNTGDNTDDAAIVTPNVDKETLGYVFFEKFIELKKADPSKTAETIAGEIMATKLGTVVQMPMVMPVEPGYLTGFAGEFDGFSSAAVFTSGMMGVAFCGYVFDLAEDADVAAFIKRVEENVDPRWNGCTEAEMTAIGAYENSVFLIMCQTKIPASISGKADILEPTVEAGSASEALWNEFKTLMASENAPTIAVDIATALSQSAFVGTVTEADWTIETEDFKYPVEGYNNAAIIAGEGKTVYVIQMDEGMDVSNWGSYYFDGINGSFGAYNMTILVMINVG